MRVVGGVVVQSEKVKRTLQHRRLLFRELREPRPDERTHAVWVVSVDYGVQEPDHKIQPDQCSTSK